MTVTSADTPRFAALVVAAGRGTRSAQDRPKQYTPLAGIPVLRRTVKAIGRDARISDIMVVVHPDDDELAASTLTGLESIATTHGGPTRQASVRLGLQALATNAPDYVLIHDAARPFLSRNLLSRTLDALRPGGGVIPGLPITDTVKAVADLSVSRTVPREGLVTVQTPQAFDYTMISRAHDKMAERTDLTDDAAVAEAAGMTVAVIPGDRNNTKLTFADDFEEAEQRLTAAGEIRVGQGFDVHAFGPGDHVILGGHEIPHQAGLAGHSDADVVLHALTDALLGAIADGDIGTHFPPSDPRWKGAASDIFLRAAATRIGDRGGVIVSVDVTIVCETPKIGAHRPAIRAQIADCLDIDLARVSVKATTTERLGFTGRGEGIATYAVASVRVPVGAP